MASTQLAEEGEGGADVGERLAKDATRVCENLTWRPLAGFLRRVFGAILMLRFQSGGISSSGRRHVWRMRLIPIGIAHVLYTDRGWMF